MLVVQISPRAQREIDEAFEWYRERSRNAASDFLDDLEAALARIADGPEHHPVVRGRLRRVLLTKFPYGIYYKIFPDMISVVGVIHGHRHPRVWLRRAEP